MRDRTMIELKHRIRPPMPKRVRRQTKNWQTVDWKWRTMRWMRPTSSAERRKCLDWRASCAGAEGDSCCFDGGCWRLRWNRTKSGCCRIRRTKMKLQTKIHRREIGCELRVPQRWSREPRRVTDCRSSSDSLEASVRRAVSPGVVAGPLYVETLGNRYRRQTVCSRCAFDCEWSDSNFGKKPCHKRCICAVFRLNFRFGEEKKLNLIKIEFEI